jgi:hypothetical protein
LHKLSSHRDKISIPLVQSKGNKKPKKYNFFNGSSTIQPYSEVEIHDTFSFQLGFSMTVYKAQGRTIDKVVLDLHYKRSHRKPLRLEGIFVTLSRVRRCSSIPPIKHTHTSFQKAYGYISRLKPAPRQSTGGTSSGYGTGTWFNELIPSTLLYFTRSANTSSFFLNI